MKNKENMINVDISTIIKDKKNLIQKIVRENIYFIIRRNQKKAELGCSHLGSYLQSLQANVPPLLHLF